MTATSATEMTPETGFSQMIRVEDSLGGRPMLAPERARQLCAQLEAGNIVLLPVSPIPIAPEDRDLLLGRRQTGSAYHKNIAYRPSEDRVTGLDASEQNDAEVLRRIMQKFSRNAVKFIGEFLLPYAEKWKLDYASFRPIEEKGRPARVHARNDLLHFDSFPTRPTNGSRILRFFVNLNPVENRVWVTSQTFGAFGPRYAKVRNLLSTVAGNSFSRRLHSAARMLHLPFGSRPPYDEFMHRCHNAMKEDAAFQESTLKHQWDFPPDSAWMVYTDCVSHAVLSGQFALEQTFLIPPSALVAREISPLAVLEKMAGRTLTL